MRQQTAIIAVYPVRIERYEGNIEVVEGHVLQFIQLGLKE